MAIPWKGRLGGTYFQGAGTAGKPAFRELEVYGGDISVEPFKFIRLEGEFSQSQWKNQGSVNAGNDGAKDRQGMGRTSGGADRQAGAGRSVPADRRCV